MIYILILEYTWKILELVHQTSNIQKSLKVYEQIITGIGALSALVASDYQQYSKFHDIEKKNQLMIYMKILEVK